MDKVRQDNTELRDEELYALLDKALETDDRLCVSEDLIQKTLKRAAEETDTKVISFETAAKRKISPMKYMGIAVAAVFVAVIGVSVLGNGGFLTNNTRQEADADRAGHKSDGEVPYEKNEEGTVMINSADAEVGLGYHSKAGEAEEMFADVANKEETLDTAPEIVGMSGTKEALPLELADALSEAGMTAVSETVECWEYADGEIDWRTELLNSLKAEENFGKKFPTSGAYQYVLNCNDGMQKILEYREPLDLIVRIETEQGMLWGLLGEQGLFVIE